MWNECLDIPLLQERYQPLDNIRTFLLFSKSFGFYYLPKGLKDKFRINHLRKLLLHAQKYVPFYRDIFKRLNISQDDIDEDAESVLQLLPVLSKEDIIAQGQQYFLSSYFRPDQLIHVRTSGSNGYPFDIFYDKNSFAYLNMIRIRSQILCGMCPWHKVIILTGDRNSPIASKRWINKLSLFRINYISGFETNSILNDKFKNFHPDVLIGYPTLIDSIGKKLCKNAKKNVRYIFTSGEPLSTELRVSLSKDYSAKIKDFYGAGEFESIAFECYKCSNYHINEDAIWIDSFTGNSSQACVNSLETLAFIATNLWSYAMPLIRYKTDDILKYSKFSNKSHCKNAFENIDSIQRARKLDFISLSNNQVILEKNIQKGASGDML